MRLRRCPIGFSDLFRRSAGIWTRAGPPRHLTPECPFRPLGFVLALGAQRRAEEENAMARILATFGLATLLVGCGANDGGNPSGKADASTGDIPVAGSGDVLNACKRADRLKVEQSLGQKAQSVRLDAVRDGSEGNGDRYSQCVFNFGDMTIAVIGTGEAYGSPSIAEQMDTMRAQMKLGSDAATENVSGIGQAALWNPGLHALYVFEGGKRFISVTLFKAGEPDQKAAAIGLARRLGA